MKIFSRIPKSPLLSYGAKSFMIKTRRHAGSQSEKKKRSGQGGKSNRINSRARANLKLDAAAEISGLGKLKSEFRRQRDLKRECRLMPTAGTNQLPK